MPGPRTLIPLIVGAAAVVFAVAASPAPAAVPEPTPDDGRGATIECGDPCLYIGIIRTGAGTIVSDPPGLDCGSQCWLEYFQAFPGEIRLTPTGATFRGWDGCPETNQVGECIVPVDNGTYCIRATFEGTGAGPVPQACLPPGSPPPPPPPPPPPSVDTQAPNTLITAGPSGSTRSRRAVFRFRASEQATFICKLDGRPWLPCRSPKAYARLAPGLHTFRTRAIDRAGNIDRTPAARRWRVLR